MTPEEGIRNYLLASLDIQNAVGSDIYPATDRQSVTPPRITYQRIDTDRSTATGGFANDGPTGQSFARIQYDVWAKDLITAKSIAGIVRKRINGFKGTVSGALSATIYLACVRVVDEQDNVGMVAQGQEKPIQRVTLDVKVAFIDD